MKQILLGYFPKRLHTPPPVMARHGVRQIGSVSSCIAEGPDGWIDAWKHNVWGFFHDPETAWSVVPREQRDSFRLYAYSLHPVEFVDGHEHAMEVVEPEIAPLGEDFRSVGWDVVSRSTGHLFECSPLSCNLMVEQVDVNAYCLFDAREDACALARLIDEQGGEPGPYHVVEVFVRVD